MKAWTNEEVEFVKLHCKNMTDLEIGCHLNKTSEQVKKKRQSLGYFKKRCGSQQQYCGYDKKRILKRITRQCWHGMMRRCYNTDDANWSHYGGRGIKVCDDWHTFEGFVSYMGLMPDKGYSIERINVNGNYEPKNCVWIPKHIQQNNTRRSIYITAWEDTKTMIDWSRDSRCSVAYSTLQNRLAAGHDAEDAIGLKKVKPRLKGRKRICRKRHFLRKTRVNALTRHLMSKPNYDLIEIWFLSKRARALNKMMPEGTPYSSERYEDGLATT